MPQRLQNDLSKRERQVMEIIYNRKEASAKEILENLPNPPSYSAVRSILYILRNKGLLDCRKEGKKNIYYPTISPKKAMRTALRSLLKTHFDNSIEKAVTAILEAEDRNMSNEELERLSELIEAAKRKGNKRDARSP
jgi:predicted transcriptional regulator